MLIDDIALTMEPQVGPRTAAHLISCFGSAAGIYSASAQELVEKAELNPEIAGRLVKKNCHGQAEAEIEYCRKNGIMPIVSDSDDYPVLLRECNDYPHVLYYKGDPAALRGRMLSMVGTRRMTSYGQKACDKLIGELAAQYPDLVIVSGLAYGVDSACHRAALTHGLTTIGVIANQLPWIYPAPHTELAAEMIKRGDGVLTEYHSGNKDKGVNFVPRNRIIAGMSAGTVVVESPLKGGSMITAGMADGYARSVMAVPGRAGDTFSEGPNYLIKSSKAVMVCSGDDIAAEMMWKTSSAKDKAAADLSMLSGEATALLAYIVDGEQVSIDKLSELSGLAMAELVPLIFELEFEGVVRMLPGKIYEKM